MTMLRRTCGLLVLVGLAYLFFWPVDVEPVAWDAPPHQDLSGVYAPNTALATVERMAEGEGLGPEDVAVDLQGRIYTGVIGGRMLQISADGKTVRTLTNTGGRPLGLALADNNTLIIADADKGLLSLDIPSGKIRVLSTIADGVPYKFADDVDIAADGTLYFSDASHKYGYGDSDIDVLEHSYNGRLIRYEPQTGETTVLLDNLQFANGVAVGPEEAFVLVNETGSYRTHRVWLSGEKAGQHDIFVENLPGFPDGISFNGKDTFWLPLVAPRNKLLDKMADKPWARKMVLRLPAFMHPKPVEYPTVLGFDLNGNLTHNLQDSSKNPYAPVTSVEEAGGHLYLGSYTAPGIARIPVPAPNVGVASETP